MRKKIITREDNREPYLIRYYLLKLKSFQIVIHKILQSDYDCLHDHPWNFISIILKGGYWEGTSPEQRLSKLECEHFKKTYGENGMYYRWYDRFSILFRKATWKHRLKLKQLGHERFMPCTTLVIMFKRKREWGFFTKSGWVHWSKYNSKQNCE